MKCLRCGKEEPRRSKDQIHCVQCAAEVAALVADDERRHRPRFLPKDLTGRVAL